MFTIAGLLAYIQEFGEYIGLKRRRSSKDTVNEL